MSDAAPAPEIPAHPGETPPPGSPTPTWVKGLIAFSLLAGAPALAGAAWFMSALMLAFASDAGVRDQARAELGFKLLSAGLGVLGSVGMPGALAVFVEPLRKPMIGLAVLGALGGAACAVVGFLTYCTAL